MDTNQESETLTALTTSELIAELQRLDPNGTMPVALRGNGATVRPIVEVSTDTLLGCKPEAIEAHPENAFFAVLKRYEDEKGIKGLGLIEKYPVVFLD